MAPTCVGAIELEGSLPARTIPFEVFEHTLEIVDVQGQFVEWLICDPPRTGSFVSVVNFCLIGTIVDTQHQHAIRANFELNRSAPTDLARTDPIDRQPGFAPSTESVPGPLAELKLCELGVTPIRITELLVDA
jgi:hypothetical protein